MDNMMMYIFTLALGIRPHIAYAYSRKTNTQATLRTHKSLKHCWSMTACLEIGAKIFTTNSWQVLTR